MLFLFNMQILTIIKVINNNFYSITMQLIVLGLFILLFTLIVFPLVGLLFSNPVGFAIALICLGLLWLIVKALFKYVLIGSEYFNNQIKKLEKYKLWNSTWAFIDSQRFPYYFSALLIISGLFAAIYFSYYPIVH